MAATSTSTGSAAGGSGKPTKTEQSLFEEDDEFEEFPAEGGVDLLVPLMLYMYSPMMMRSSLAIQTLALSRESGPLWREINVNHIHSPLPSPEWDVHGEDVGDRQLWEDNWDDDNVEDDFSCQLRWERTFIMTW